MMLGEMREDPSQYCQTQTHVTVSQLHSMLETIHYDNPIKPFYQRFHTLMLLKPPNEHVSYT